MTAATERIVIQLSPTEKRKIAKDAAREGLNVSEFLRRAARSFLGTEDDRQMESLLVRTQQAAQESMAIIDETIAFIAKSNLDITALRSSKRR